MWVFKVKSNQILIIYCCLVVSVLIKPFKVLIFLDEICNCLLFRWHSHRHTLYVRLSFLLPFISSCLESIGFAFFNLRNVIPVFTLLQ